MDESTFRFTVVAYFDQEGTKHEREYPGWIGGVPALMDDATVDVSTIATVLGQSYVERPYRDPSEAPEELLVVELHSDGGARQMFQEFSGVQPEQLDGLLRKRLGSDAPDQWAYVRGYRILR